MNRGFSKKPLPSLKLQPVSIHLNLKLKSIHREKYDDFDDVLLIPKGQKGKEIDRILSGCLVTLRSTGELQKLHRKVHLPYQDWQPY